MILIERNLAFEAIITHEKSDRFSPSFVETLIVFPLKLLHGPRQIGFNSEEVAHELMKAYYKDHQMYYERIQNFVLHLHIHFSVQYRLHGSLCHLGSFGQESLLGSLAKNRHGTRFLGETIIDNYNVSIDEYSMLLT